MIKGGLIKIRAHDKAKKLRYALSMTSTSRPLAYWLFMCCLLIFAMILIGAITRLTESGLSMVEWRAMIDMLPPLTEHRWLHEFQHYQQTPEYLQKNTGMSLAAFKRIYFWEWLHRLLGRLIGLAYALPLVYFWGRGKIAPGLKPRFAFFLFLGGLQGFFGWYMVKSGLVNEPRVSHYRLALHFGTALVLLVCLWLQALALWPRTREIARRTWTPVHQKLLPHGWIALGLLCCTILYGAFVAGLDAGLIYNEFPTMGGKLIPGEWLFLKPWWVNFLQNHATVQWTHRVLGSLSFITLFAFGLRSIWSGNVTLKKLGLGLCAIITTQFILGISTLLSHVDTHLAITHQAGAVLTLLTVVTTILFLRSGRR